MKLRKWYIIPYVVCTGWFLYSPSLRLSKADVAYQEYGSEFMQWMLDELKFSYVMRAYLLLLALITLLFFMIKKFHGKSTVIAIACTGILLHVLSYYAEFPTLGQIGLVWSNDSISQNDVSGIFVRYQYFLTWLEGWLIVLAIITAFLYIYHRLKKA